MKTNSPSKASSTTESVNAFCASCATRSTPGVAPARREYSYELKLAAVEAFIGGGKTRREVVEEFDIASISTLKKWVIAYRQEGSAALQEKQKGRPCGHREVILPCSNEVEAVRFEVRRLLTKLG